MTTETLRLDPRRVSEAEPSIGDGRSQMMLSADAVPREITTGGASNGLLTRVEFGYGGKELPAADETLDGVGDPRVTITPGQVTDKVLKLVFDRPINAPGLVRVAERLRAKAISLDPAKRLSFLMTATMLEWIAERLLNPR